MSKRVKVTVISNHPYPITNSRGSGRSRALCDTTVGKEYNGVIVPKGQPAFNGVIAFEDSVDFIDGIGDNVSIFISAGNLKLEMVED